MKKRIVDKQNGFFALFISAFFYATFGSLIRVLSISFETFSQVAIRCIITFVLATIIILVKKYSLTIPKAPPMILLIFFVVPSLSIMFLTYAITLVEATNALFYLYAGYIVSTNIIGKVLYKETLTVGKLVAIGIALMGIFFFSYPFASIHIVGMFFGVLAGCMDGISSGLCKYLGNLNNTVLIWYRYGVGAVLSLCLLVLFQEHIIGIVTPITVLAALALGLFVLCIDYLWLYGFSHFDVNTGSIVTAVELIIAPILNAIAWREYPGALEYIGGICIISAVVMINIQVSKHKFAKEDI